MKTLATRKSVMKLAGPGLVAMAGLLGPKAGLAQQAPPIIPPEIAAILKEHVGRFHSVMEMQVDGRTITLEGTRECAAVEAGAGVLCRWHDSQSPDGQPREDVEILGFDPEAGLLRSARISAFGVLTTSTIAVAGNVMTVRSETNADGVATVRFNQITVVPGGGWTQRFTVDADGKRVMEGTIRHERLAQ